MKKLSKVQVLGIVRHVLTFTGGILVAKGLINDSTMVELVGGIVTVVGMSPLFTTPYRYMDNNARGPYTLLHTYVRTHTRLQLPKSTSPTTYKRA
jgi:hypothetical protein